MIGNKRLLVGATAMAIGVALGMATMVAAVNGFTIVQGTGTDINRVKTKAADGSSFSVTDATDDAFAVAADVPDARHRLVLTEETLVVARFQANTNCAGGPGVCEATIHVLDNGAGDAEVDIMEPGEITWDQADADGLEVQGIERSLTLPAGDYDFQVRIGARDTGGDTTFTIIPSWHYTIERIV